MIDLISPSTTVGDDFDNDDDDDDDEVFCDSASSKLDITFTQRYIDARNILLTITQRYIDARKIY